MLVLERNFLQFYNELLLPVKVNENGRVQKD